MSRYNKKEFKSIEEILQIYIVTYNRKYKLERTLRNILKDNSPIKNCAITILDNNSTDSTPRIIQKYKEEFENIEYIKNPINIGGNANICRAFELAANCGKNYCWVLCDDDKYNFSHWDEIEKVLLTNRYDCVLTEWKHRFSSDNLPYVINSLAFVPAGIYKVKNLTPSVIYNAEANIMYSFPHLAVGCSLLNNKKQFYVPKYRVVKQQIDMAFTRGCNSEVHFRMAHVNLFSSYINSYQMIQDKKLRYSCCNVLWVGRSFLYSMIAFWKTNGLYWYNICDTFLGISLLQKVQLILAGLIVFFNNIFRNLFEITNSYDRKYKILTISGFKIRWKKKNKT